jgi:hypothetical protein
MPPDPTAPLPPSERLPTKPDDIGQVAPDFDDRKHFNSLVIRPQYRITLRMGEIEDLFPNKPDTDKGRMERMQVLGLFYLPLKHKKAAAALPVAWDHYKKNILNNASDAQADADIQDRLKKKVVDGGALPTPAGEGATPAEANFAKLRLPGGYTFVNTLGGAAAVNLNRDSKYPLDFGANMHRVEDFYYKDNPVLGKIPLVAKVEKRADDQGQWRPAEGVHVYFQLLPPYDLPAFDPNRGCNQQLNRPPLRESTVGPPAVATGRGPKKLNDAEESRIAPVPTDPQSGNCPSDRGGKRGKPVAGNIFETTSQKGFNEPHSGRDLPHKQYPVAQSVNPAGTSHAHAVKAVSNEDGEAGVIFMPSRAGGDRYRLRAYIGPKTLLSDGTGMEGVRVDTGTLVIWRNVRISRYIQQPANAPEAGLLAQANPAPYNLATANDYLRSVRVVDGSGNNVGLPTADFSAQGNASNVFDGVIKQFARGFCEVEIDRAAQLPETLSQADWAAARQQAVQDASAAQPALNTNYDLTILFCMEAGSPVNVNNAVCHVPMRSAEAYNAQLPAGSPRAMTIPAGGGASQTDKNNMETLFWDVLMAGFLRSLTKNGYLPGITVITGGFGATWQVLRQLARNSGVAVEYRGAFVWLGQAAYPTALNVPQPSMTYDFTSNTCHEIGHTIYRQHGPGNDPGRNAGGGANATVHDPLADSICVMSYRSCEGQFCAKCLFAFRGWNIAGMTQV